MVLYSSFSSQMSKFKLTGIGSNLYTFLNNKWHFDYIYNNYLVKPLLVFGYSTSYKVLDRGLIDRVGPYGVAHQLSRSTQNLSAFQSGQVYNYAFTIFVAATLFLFGLGAWAYFTVRADLVIGLLILLIVLDFSSQESKA
jgi:NADH-ubiquinone oxidoreductase chain 5